MQHNPNSTTLIRPSSHYSSNRNSVTTISCEENKRRSIVILSLIAACVFLFVLVLCLLAALVLVGKNFSRNVNSHNNEFANLQSQIVNSDNFIVPPVIQLLDVNPVDNENFVNVTTIFLPNKFANRSNSINKSAESDLSRAAGARNMNLAKFSSRIIEKLSFRLPTFIKPSHYDLYMFPNLNSETFSGKVAISLKITEPTTFIVLHSKQLVISDTALSQIHPDGSDNTVQIVQSFEYPEHEYFVVQTEDIGVGNYRLDMSFTGSLAKRIVGFYSSTYLVKDKKERRTIATSKFEPTFARQAFPCFDEPNMKATFNVTLVRPTAAYSALSNMNQKSETENKPSAGLTTVEFETSVKMSTYLAVFLISDFKKEHEIVNPPANLGKPFELSIYAPTAQINKVEYARETAKKIIEFYIDYFQIEYPLPKLDLAAIPDFVSGAMETWGLVTFRETSLLYDNNTSSTANKQRVATVIAHELAHMWFGNLVTMNWWNDLWLNEGFASYIEYKGTNVAHPKWGIMEQFVIDDLHGVLSLDATFGSHPIIQKVDSPNQITEIFDTITYAKGASIIRMLENFVGDQIFREGVTAYLNKHKFGNAETKDLFAELDALYTGGNVTEIMATWTEQKGFPVINVEKLSNSQYRITQTRFLADPDNENEKDEESIHGYKWAVPITYKTSTEADREFSVWFKPTVPYLTLDVRNGVADSWIKINQNQVGYYRVNYPVETWKRFEELLNKDVNAFSIGDRTSLLNDAFSLSDATKLSYNATLDLTKYLKKETEYVPWSVAASKLKAISSLLYHSESYFDMIKYTQSLVEDVYQTVTWQVPESNTDDDHMKNRLRATILELACSEEHSNCLKAAGKLFTEWLKEKKPQHPDLRSVVYYYGIASAATPSDWDAVFEIFKTENDAQEKTKLMSALAAYPDERILNKYLLLAHPDNKIVRSQDYLNVLTYISQNRKGEQLVWDYVRESWDDLIRIYGLGERNLGRLIPSITKKFARKSRKQEMEDFFSRYPDAGAGATARVQALENVENNIKWVNRHESVIAKWLKENEK